MYRDDIITLITTTSIAQIEARQDVDDLIDNLMVLDESGDVHLPSAAGKQQGGEFMNLMNHLSPFWHLIGTGGRGLSFNIIMCP